MQAIWPDGRPAAEVQLQGDCLRGRTETGADGRVSIQSLAQTECAISARARVNAGEYARSNEVIVPPGERAAAVVLALR